MLCVLCSTPRYLSAWYGVHDDDYMIGRKSRSPMHFVCDFNTARSAVAVELFMSDYTRWGEGGNCDRFDENAWCCMSARESSVLSGNLSAHLMSDLELVMPNARSRTMLSTLCFSCELCCILGWPSLQLRRNAT